MKMPPLKNFERLIDEWLTPSRVRLACGHEMDVDETAAARFPPEELSYRICLECFAAVRAEVKAQNAATFSLPSECAACGTTLMGGATQHRPGCSIGKLIEQYFPRRPV